MSEKELICTRALDREFVLESYGVRVRIQASDQELLTAAQQRARQALVGRIEILEIADTKHSFGLASDDEGNVFLFQDGVQITYGTSLPRLLKFFDSMLRIKIAEHAVGWVFIHAGVVGWKGKAIVIPANSFQGKTTLVTELIKNGADYYSDEYAVIDEHGLVYPFPRELSVRRLSEGTVLEESIPVETLGAKIGSKPLRIGLVLLTEYEENAVWNPIALTPGQGMMEVLPHTIPRIFNTEFSLKVLNTAVSDAIILKSTRGDAGEFAIKLLSFFDNFTNLAKIT